MSAKLPLPFSVSPVTLNFGHATSLEDYDAVAEVSAPWATAASRIVCTPTGIATADHDPDDYVVENVSAIAVSIVPGAGFIVHATAPGGTWGRYTFNVIGF